MKKRGAAEEDESSPALIKADAFETLVRQHTLQKVKAELGPLLSPDRDWDVSAGYVEGLCESIERMCIVLLDRASEFAAHRHGDYLSEEEKRKRRYPGHRLAMSDFEQAWQTMFQTE